MHPFFHERFEYSFVEQTLTAVSLSNNHIETDGIKSIGEALSVNQVSLTFLFPLGVQQFHLTFAQTLTSLSLQNTSINAEGAEHLARGLGMNQVRIETNRLRRHDSSILISEETRFTQSSNESNR